MMFTTTTVALGLMATLGYGFTIHPSTPPGTYWGSIDAESSLNHTRLSDDHPLAKRSVGSAKFALHDPRNLSKRNGISPICKGDRPSDGDKYTLRQTLGQMCDADGVTPWVNPRNTVYTHNGAFAAFYCNYSNEEDTCSSSDVQSNGVRMDSDCPQSAGELYHNVGGSGGWFGAADQSFGYGIMPNAAHFCTSDGQLAQQEGRID